MYMSTVKETLKNMADTLPEEASWEDALETLILRIKLDAARKDIAEGRTFTIEEAERRLLG